MKRPDQLQIVRGIAESREQSLAREVGQALSEKADADAMLARLSEYVADYTGNTSIDSTRPFAIQNRHRFVARLSGALATQRGQVDRVAERAAAKMQSWNRARADVEALDRLMTRRTQDADRVSARREQRESDAAAQRIAGARAKPDDPGTVEGDDTYNR